MPLPSLTSILRCRRPLLAYAAAWTALLTAMVALTSFSPEIAFVWAVSPPSRFSQACQGFGVDASIRVPTDVPGEVVCLPAVMFGRSRMDLVVPPLFAAVVVAGSAAFVRAFGLWEVDEREEGR